MVKKSIIARNFSRSAGSYDGHSEIQKNCAQHLLDSLDRDNFSRILEIGCGTGSFTKMLSEKYKTADIIAIDISETMIKAAQNKINDKNVYFMLADGEAISLDKKLDLIASNATFQWFENLDNTFLRFKNMMHEGGVLCFSMYGPKTFKELSEVLKANLGDHHALSSVRFPTQNQLISVLQKHFSKFNIAEMEYTIDFFSLWEFLKDIKNSGAQGEGLGDKVFLGKHMIKSLEEDYMNRFGGITSTHHVYFCKAVV